MKYVIGEKGRVGEAPNSFFLLGGRKEGRKRILSSVLGTEGLVRGERLLYIPREEEKEEGEKGGERMNDPWRANFWRKSVEKNGSLGKKGGEEKRKEALHPW